MLQTLLSPLRSRFDLSPRTPTLPEQPNPSPTQPEDDNLNPEEFAKDVLIELMRNAVEKLKQADDQRNKSETLSEIHRIMLQDACTKDVFKEMDGFLYLMSVLSSIQDRPTGVAVVEPEAQVLQETIQCTRWVFLIFSEAMKNHHANTEYFRNRVGYESLSHALGGLVSERKTMLETMGFLLSLSLCDFSLSNFFSSLRDVPHNTIDAKIAEFHLGTIKNPEALMILWNLPLPRLTGDSSNLNEHDSSRYALFKLFELLFHVNHRNHAILCGLGLIKSVFARFYETKMDAGVLEKERHVLQKLLRRLLEMGATTTEARGIFQKAVVLKEVDGKSNEVLDGEILEVVRFGMKSRWVEHFSMETPAAIVVRDEKFKGLPVTGFTFMMWFRLSDLPSGEGSHCLFGVHMPLHVLIKLSLRTDGKLELISSSNEKPAVFTTSSIRKSRWTHIALVHYPHRGPNPNIRLYVDGAFVEGLSWAYPRPEGGFQIGKYVIGDDSSKTKMSWCLASSHFLATPLSDELPRLVHHLGPRYADAFQDPHMVKFLTYEASTSLNMFLALKSTIPLPKSKPVEQTSIVKALKRGMGIPETSVIFTFSAAGAPGWSQDKGIGVRSGIGDLDGEIEGDVFTVKAECLDMALWKIGGAAVVLRLVQLATTPHEISRALGILTDGLRNSWQNSEDMERLRGYEILADILRTKAQSINLTAFETLFEFLGVNFNIPEQSTIVNVVAYRAIALDFGLWSRTRKEIQCTHFEHFTTLLQTSKYKIFNMKQRVSSMDLVRKLLFALQADWYSQDVLVPLLEALKVVARASFDKDDTIKPMVSYLAANLPETSSGDHSPHSIISRFELKNPREKAEQVLLILTDILFSRPHYLKFASALPMARICLLLLGDRPTPVVATQILNLIGLSIQLSSSFNRKFELISGWLVLKTVLPSVWDPQINKAAFDLLLGRLSVDIGPSTPTSSSASSSKSRLKSKQPPKAPSTTVSCTHILPIIISALQTGLTAMKHCYIADDEEASPSSPLWSTKTAMENLIEELLTLHATSSTFRQIFESQQTTQLFIDTYKSLVDNLSSSASSINDWNARILEKLTHFGLALALDNAVGGTQKREILNQIQAAENILHPTSQNTMIDPGLVVDNRSVRQRIASARFSMQIGERTVIKTITKMSEWRKTIQVSEKKRIRKTVLDLRENRRQVSRMQEWTYLLTSERGLWPRPESFLWRLDETEGPHRIRKKLEPQNENNPSSRVDALDEVIRDVRPPEVETSGFQIEVPPWTESYEISATDMDDNQQLAEEIVDDKLRRVRHELEPGDVIEAVATVARIDGVDSSPGLFILGRTHIYMLDGVVENEEGEVIDAHDAPKRLLFIPGSIVELDGPQRARRWVHNQIVTYSDKRFLFRDVALEIYFRDSRSLLVVFLDKKRRSDFEQHLPSIMGRPASELVMSPGAGSQSQRTPLLGRMSSRMMSGFRVDELSSATRKWQARELSNFAYLSILNQISGRTPSDATQYPVFPWVLSDYSSSILDLNSRDSFRDLTKPMGALTPARRQAAETRYANLEGVGEEPFHYGTHFSSSMIVCHFLIRLAPFTNMFKTLQGGDWDIPDRLFSDLPRAYESAAQDVRGDVRELIPEFFTCPEFLENSANHDFGVMQGSEERIHDVKLPPWARQDPLLFIVLNRRALESPIVSEQLPAWIDLIWGSNQRDAASLNAFHPLSYEGSIDLDSIQDDLEREATVGIIHNFGQTPRKLFTSPHPERYLHGLHSLPLGTQHGIEEDPHLLAQGPRCFKDLGPAVPVRDLVLDTMGDKMVPCPEGMLSVPQYPHESVEWRIGSAELRVVVDHKVVQVVEYAFCTCAVFADASSLITGSSDYTVRLWKLVRGPNPNSSSSAMQVSLSHIMRVHTDEVTCVTASRPWSLVVSGSKDGSAALWDLNRGVYVRSIWHGEGEESTAVDLVAINESTGYIATCSRLKLCLHTVNGRHIAMLDLTKTSSFSALVPTVTSIAFHEREYSHLGVLATGGPDGSITLRTWTADGTPEGEKAQWEFLTIRTMKVRMLGQNRPPSVTALKFLGESLYHGEETGKSFVWSLPDN